MLPIKFQVNWPFSTEEEAINRFSRWRTWQLGFLTGIILAIFDLQVTLMLPAKFQINGSFGSVEEAKNRFSRWQPRSDWKDLSFLDLQVTPMLPTKFQVNWPFGSGEKVKKKDFQDPRWPSWILDFVLR